VYPSVVIGFWASANQASGFGVPPVTLAGFTELADSRGGGCSWVGAFSTLAITGYNALSAGSPPSFSTSWGFGGNPIGWRGLAAYLPTAATSPVQTANQCGSGDTVTFGSPVTPGNVIIACRFLETTSISPPVGWTTIVPASGFAGGVDPSTDTMYMDIIARCATEGDGTSFVTGDSSFSHWAFASEWELT